MSVCVKYIIPEDGDDQNHPNVFFISTAQANLGDLRKTFPVPGEYHFRFLRNVGDMKVWMDFNDDSLALPISDGSIFAKISRVNGPPTAPSSGTRQMENSVNSNNSQTTTQVPQQAAKAPISAPAPAPVQTAPSVTSVKSPPPPVQRRGSEKLIKFDDDIESPHPAAANVSTASSSDLLGFDTPIAASATSGSNVDLFGLETLQPTVSNPIPNPMAPMQLRQPTGMGANNIGGMNAMAGGSRIPGTNSPGPMSGGNINNSYNPLGAMGGGMSSGAMGGVGSGGGGGIGMNSTRGNPMGGGYDAFSSLGQGATSGRGGPAMGGNQYAGGRGNIQSQQQQQRR